MPAQHGTGGQPIERPSAHGPHYLQWVARAYLWASERLYHELAWAYDAVSWLVSGGRWSHWRRQALAHVAGPRVLEIGFGTGELLAEMAGRGWQVCGLELSPAMQRITARKLRRRGMAVARLRGRAQALPFADASLDAAIATFPAGFIVAPATWQEVARVLRRPNPAAHAGGRFVVAGLYVEGDRGPLSWVGRLIHSRPGVDIVDRCRALAAAAGLELARVAGDAGPVRAPVLVFERR